MIKINSREGATVLLVATVLVLVGLFSVASKSVPGAMQPQQPKFCKGHKAMVSSVSSARENFRFVWQ